MDRKLERVARFVRTRQRQPDFVRKAGPMRSRKAYTRDTDEQVREAIKDWLEEGEYNE